jgi:hypothetical protein
MKTRFRDGGLYYMGGKYGGGGMYPQFDNGGKGDPKKIKSANTNNIDFNSGDDTVKSTRTYTEGETTGEYSDWQKVPAYRAAKTSYGTYGQNVSGTMALLDRLSSEGVETRFVDDQGNPLSEKEYKKYLDAQIEEARKNIGQEGGEERYRMLQGIAEDLPNITQEQEGQSNIFGDVAKGGVEKGMKRVQDRLGKESHWFNPNLDVFGPGGFDVSNPAHVIEYQMMYNQLAGPGEQIKVDGKWGEQTDSAHVPVENYDIEEGQIDPELEMRLYTERPSGGWNQEETGGSGGDYRGGGGGRGGGRGGGSGGGGLFPGECRPGRPCAAHLEDGGLTKLKTKFKDGGVYYMK